jgi:hypothetical protein
MTPRPWSNTKIQHVQELRNKARKSAALARTIVDSGVFTDEDVDDLLARSDVRGAILRATLDEKGQQRWAAASDERWNEAVVIAHAFLRDV